VIAPTAEVREQHRFDAATLERYLPHHRARGAEDRRQLR
jgi:hypothetical protein